MFRNQLSINFWSVVARTPKAKAGFERSLIFSERAREKELLMVCGGAVSMCVSETPVTLTLPHKQQRHMFFVIKCK
jgi:hypothetical protein